MARPRKDAGVPQARQRIIDAFWELLETHRLHDITVNMLAQSAHCNRGTFYYHYTDMDALVYTAIEEEFYGEDSLPEQFIALLGQDGAQAARSLLSGRRVGRISLVIRQGGLDAVEGKMKDVLVGYWESVLCPHGEPLEPRVRIAIEYNASGILSLIAFCLREENSQLVYDDLQASVDFVTQFAAFMLDYIATAQGLSQDELFERLSQASEQAKRRRG